MTFRPDIVDVWPYRVVGGTAEILLLRRAPDRVLAGLWQCVSGSTEPGERIVSAALRELAEETGFGRDAIERFYDLDLVNSFHWAPADAVVSSAVFAARVRPEAEPELSHEHDAARWVPLEAAIAELVWPGYREAVRRVADNLLDPERAPWFELAVDGVAPR